MSGRRSRIGLECARDQLEGFGGLATLMQEHAAQMQTVEISRLNGEDLPIERLGLVQLSALMMRHGAPQQIDNVQLRFGLRIGHRLGAVPPEKKTTTQPAPNTCRPFAHTPTLLTKQKKHFPPPTPPHLAPAPLLPTSP